MATYDETPPDVFVSINITLTDPEAQTLRLATCGPVWHGDTDTQRDQVLIEAGNIPTGDGVDSQFQFKVKDVPLSVTIGIEGHTTDIPKVSKLLNLYDFAGATVKVWHGTRYTGGDFTTDQTWEGVIEGVSAIDANSVTFMASSEGQIRNYQLPSKYIQDPTLGRPMAESLGEALPVCLGDTQESLVRIAKGGVYSGLDFGASFTRGATYMGMNPSFFPCLKGRHKPGTDIERLKIYLGEICPLGVDYKVETRAHPYTEDWLLLNGRPSKFYTNSVIHSDSRRDAEGWYYDLEPGTLGQWGKGPHVYYPVYMGPVSFDDSDGGDADKTVDGRWDTYSKLTAGTTQKLRWTAPNEQKIGNIRAKMVEDSLGPAGVSFCILHGTPKGVTPGPKSVDFRIWYHETGGSFVNFLTELGLGDITITLSQGTAFDIERLHTNIWLQQVDGNYPNPWYKNWQMARVQETENPVKVDEFMFEIDATNSTNDVYIVGVCLLFGISLAQNYRGNDAVFWWGYHHASFEDVTGDDAPVEYTPDGRRIR